MKQEKNHSMLSWISAVAGRAKIYIGLLTLVQILLGISGVAYALFLRGIIDAATAGDKGLFIKGALSFVGLVVLQIILRAISRFLVEYTKINFQNKFKERVFSALLTKNYQSVNTVHSGEWLNRLTSDTQVVADGLVQILPGLSGMVVKLVAALVMLIILEPRFLYVVLPGGLALLVLSYSFRKVLKKMHKRIQEADGKVRILFQEYMESLLVVRAYGKEDMAKEEAEDKMRAHKKTVLRRSHFSNISNMGFGVVMHGAYVIGAIYCGYGILMNTISYGTMTAVLQLIGQIQSPFANITGFLPKYYAMIASAERLKEAEELPDKEVQYVLEAQEVHRRYQEELQAIGLKGVGFTYQSMAGHEADELVQKEHRTVVLKDIDLHIEKGEYVAFTGPSGCGKSTAFKLFLGLYPLDEGERYLEFASGREPLHSGWQKLFAYVPQGNHLMSGTIREVVAFADKEKMADDERIQRALRVACAKDFVDELESGVETELGERGLGLSEGQLQRIAIARAVFSDNPILMLDESTSALDEKTEKQLLSNLRSVTNKTVLLVTHRPAVLDICDKIIEFHQEGVRVFENKACKLPEAMIE